MKTILLLSLVAVMLGITGLVGVAQTSPTVAVGRVAPPFRPKVKPSYWWPVAFDLSSASGREQVLKVTKQLGYKRLMLSWDAWADVGSGWAIKPGVRELVDALHAEGVCVGAQVAPLAAPPNASWLSAYMEGSPEPDGWRRLTDEGVIRNCQRIAERYVAVGFDWIYSDYWEAVAEYDSEGRWIDWNYANKRSTWGHETIKGAINRLRGRMYWYETSEHRYDGYYLDQFPNEPLLPFAGRCLLSRAKTPGVPGVLGQIPLWSGHRVQPSIADYHIVLELSLAEKLPVCLALWPACLSDPAWEVWASLTRNAELRRVASLLQ